ncbi:hypothetical protein [Legionella massiliensis]|uniref:hypothetical protein n=1 Tax=Legionella massiliensis TaxID=1034943 RepID=UPI00159EB9C8|nr:hypothetical protein [Legionella massiliensis]
MITLVAMELWKLLIPLWNISFRHGIGKQSTTANFVAYTRINLKISLQMLALGPML